MSIIAVFRVPTLNAEQYNRVMRDLEEAGQGKPEGRLYHVASVEDDGSLVVTDVWSSAELLTEFGNTLIPILINAGVTPAEPIVRPVLNVVERQ